MNPVEVAENIWGDIERQWRSELPAQDKIEARVVELSSTLPSLDEVKQGHSPWLPADRGSAPRTVRGR
jgi:hypothetical protein